MRAAFKPLGTNFAILQREKTVNIIFSTAHVSALNQGSL